MDVGVEVVTVVVNCDESVEQMVLACGLDPSRASEHLTTQHFRTKLQGRHRFEVLLVRPGVTTTFDTMISWAKMVGVLHAEYPITLGVANQYRDQQCSGVIVGLGSVAQVGDKACVICLNIYNGDRDSRCVVLRLRDARYSSSHRFVTVPQQGVTVAQAMERIRATQVTV